MRTAETPFTLSTGIRHPIIMAPMFLVSNLDMIREAMLNGIMGVFPSLNFRKEGELDELLKKLNEMQAGNTISGNYGVNLIVQRSNFLYKKHLDSCVRAKVPFYITSLGNPAEVIREAHAYGALVYSDVTNLEHAKKCYNAGCDGFIAVGQGAGGHAGPFPLHLLIPSLRKAYPDKPIVAAGGIASGEGMLAMLALGASAVSIGTRFIASAEAGVSNEYKNAVVGSGMQDIVLTERISGTPCTIINTPYAKKIGYKQNLFEKLLSTNSATKKYFKALTHMRGMKWLADSIKPGNYHTLWCAGQSVELIKEIKPVKDIISDLLTELSNAHSTLYEILRQPDP